MKKLLLASTLLLGIASVGSAQTDKRVAAKKSANSAFSAKTAAQQNAIDQKRLQEKNAPKTTKVDLSREVYVPPVHAKKN